MEKHKCKLCFRNFSNGRALGGHMRSHMMNLHVPPKPNESPPPSPPAIQLSFEAESSTPPSPSVSSSSYFGKEDDTSLYYGLRENPKRSFRIADPEFSFVAAGDTGSVILQEDRESETESSKNVTKKRSKRAWKLGGGGGGGFNSKKVKLSELGNGNNKNESASSASDATTEEDIALWLMMLSRDTGNNWKINHKMNINIEEQEQELEEEEEDDDEKDEEDEDEEEEEEDEGEESDEYEVVKNKAKSNKVRGGRYKCETCNKVFRSYQALGGHRASHKKMKMDYNNNNDSEFMVIEDHVDENVNNASSALASVENGNNNNGVKKIHECPVCFRVFASGQALGGHKRTHVTTVSTPTITTRAIAEVKAEAEAIAASKAAVATASSSKLGRESFIDLNLPAPAEEDDASQFEDSAVSDAEFVNPVKVFPR